MKDIKIRILKDTPFDGAGNELTLSDFKKKYNYLYTKDTTDEELIKWLEREHKYQQDTPYPRNMIGDWFEVIHPPKFEVGDWVWHENLKKAYCVTRNAFDDWRPHYVSIAAVNEYTHIYKRKATPEEISKNDLYLCCDGKVLVGHDKSYYWIHNSSWREVNGVKHVISRFINMVDFINNGINICEDDSPAFNVLPTGLKIGCITAEYNEIIKVAKFLKLIP